MDGNGIWSGIDIAKATLDVRLGSGGPVRTFANTTAGHRQLLAWVTQAPVAGIVVEATGPYHQAIVAALTAAHLPVPVVNPQWIKHFRASSGRAAKNDRADADLLARYGEQKHPAPSRQPSRAERELQELVAAREDLVTLRTAERNRLQMTTNTLIRSQLTGRIDALTTDITALEDAIDGLIAADPAMMERRTLLESMPGIGPVISATLLAYLPEIDALSRRQLAALAGLAPYDQDSGTQRGQRHISGGRVRVRRALYQAATTSRRNTVLGTRWTTLRSRRPHKVAMIALARYQLSMLAVMVREHLRWEDTRVGQGMYLHDQSALPAA